MSTTRRYVSPKREAAAEATRQAILDAFRDQLIEPGRDTLSPTEAAAQVGCSVRTVHGHFPTKESRIEALAERLEAELYAEPVAIPSVPADLPDHYRRIHRSAMSSQLATALIRQTGAEWRAVRAERRKERIDAVRRVVASIGAPAEAERRATAMLLTLASGEITLLLRDEYGLAEDDIPETVVQTVELLIADLERAAAEGRR